MKTYIRGTRKFSNFFWSVALTGGGINFFLVGLSTYLKTNLIFYINTASISYIPQGIVLMFYGSVGSILGIFLCLTSWWDVGSGYNEYNYERILICRKGYPGKNRLLSFSIFFNEIESIKITSKTGTLQLLICLKDGRAVPLIGNQQFLTLRKAKEDAIALSQYIWDSSSFYVPLEVETRDF